MERSTRRSNQLPTNLPQLQNLIKRDPVAYTDEFLQQRSHYQALLQLFLLSPSQDSKKLAELVMFLCQVTQCYPKEMTSFPEDLQGLLRQHATILHADVRLTLCRGLILMRNKGILQPQGLLELFFELFRCQDKLLRATLYRHIVTDIRGMNAKHKNNKLNRALQNFMYSMLSDSSQVAAKMSLDVMIELYQRNIWNDAKTVNVITTACFSPVSKISRAAIKFFLTSDDAKEDDSSSESEGEGAAMRKVIISKQTSKKGRKLERKKAKALATIKQKSKRKQRKVSAPASFSALHLINDPQSFAEKLFDQLQRTRENFGVRVMMMSLLSRLIGLHELFLFNFYPYIQRYLQPHQQDVTRILTFLAQATHQLVPPEVIEPVLGAVVNNFISERNSSDAIAIGLNTVREMCVRCPLAMTSELLQDLAAYKSFRDKGVMMAARSVIQLFRRTNPELLQRKDRGRPLALADGGRGVRPYGAQQPDTIVPGTELVDLPLDAVAQKSDDGIESDSDANSDSSGWIDMHHHSDDEDNDIHGSDVDSDSDWTECEMESEDEKSDVSDPELEAGDNFIDDREGGTSLAELERLGGKSPAISTNQSSMTGTTTKSSKRSRRKRKLDHTDKESAEMSKEVAVERELPQEVLEQLRRQRTERASEISQSRFLTQEEFRKIRLKQLAAELEPKKGKRRQIVELEDGQTPGSVGGAASGGELLSEDAINLVHKRRKLDKNERVDAVKAGREGRDKFGSRKHKLNPQSSTSNRQKERGKAFAMVKRKKGLRRKSQRSFREKQLALRKTLSRKPRK